jgi:hypothetical protein
MDAHLAGEMTAEQQTARARKKAKTGQLRIC